MSQGKKLTEQTFSGFLFLITGSSIQVLLKVGVLALLARLVTPQEFGLMGMAIIVVEFSKLFTHMGVGPAIVQRKEIHEHHLTTGFTLSLMMGVFFAALLALIAPLLASFFRMEELVPVLRIVSLVFFIDSLTLIGQALMQRNMKFKAIAMLEVVSYGIGYGVVGIILGYFGWGVWALVTAHLSQAVLHAAFVIIVQPFSKRLRFSSRAFKDLIYFGGGMTIGRIGNYLASQGDNLVVGRMLGASALGIYGRAYQFMVMPASLFGSALDKSLFPAMAKVQDNKQKLGKAYITGVSTIALIAIPLGVLSMLLAPEIVSVVLGPNWNEVIIPFQILAGSLLFRMSYKMSDSLARATGAVYKRAWRQILFAVLVVTGSYIGQFWGLPGVAFGVVVALVMNFLMMLQLSIRLTNLSWLAVAEAHKPGLLLGIITGITSFSTTIICRHYMGYEFFTLLITVLTTTAIILPVVFYFPDFFLKEDQKELLSKPFMKHLKKLHPQSA